MADAISVLVVDDEADGREALSAMLGSMGFEVEAAAGGEQALARLARAGDGGPDVVLMDVRMPGLDGIEALARYRAGGGRRPVVMISALDQVDTVLQAVRRGAVNDRWPGAVGCAAGGLGRPRGAQGRHRRRAAGGRLAAVQDACHAQPALLPVGPGLRGLAR